MEERITLPLTHEDRDYLRTERSEVVRDTTPRPRGGARPLETHEQLVAEVEAAIAEHRQAANSQNKRTQAMLATSA